MSELKNKIPCIPLIIFVELSYINSLALLGNVIKCGGGRGKGNKFGSIRILPVYGRRNLFSKLRYS
jgi:hypothetical protein